jgi:hypothetical protein
MLFLSHMSEICKWFNITCTSYYMWRFKTTVVITKLRQAKLYQEKRYQTHTHVRV